MCQEWRYVCPECKYYNRKPYIYPGWKTHGKWGWLCDLQNPMEKAACPGTIEKYLRVYNNEEGDEDAGDQIGLCSSCKREKEMEEKRRQMRELAEEKEEKRRKAEEKKWQKEDAKRKKPQNAKGKNPEGGKKVG